MGLAINISNTGQQGLQKKYCKSEQYRFGAWGQAATSLKIVDLSWKYKINNNAKIKNVNGINYGRRTATIYFEWLQF
jgi:hypothetical protein